MPQFEIKFVDLVSFKFEQPDYDPNQKLADDIFLNMSIASEVPDEMTELVALKVSFGVRVEQHNETGSGSDGKQNETVANSNCVVITESVYAVGVQIKGLKKALAEEYKSEIAATAVKTVYPYFRTLFKSHAAATRLDKLDLPLTLKINE